MPKKRVVTATKTMRFETFYGTAHTKERQQHAEEREAKRWLNTRLDNARDHTVKYDPVVAEYVSDILRAIKGKDLMAMKPGGVTVWDYTYSGMHIYCGVERLP